MNFHVLSPEGMFMSDSDDELDFEIISSTRQLAAPPPLQHKTVTLDWKTTSGKAARFLAWEITASDYADFAESGWTYKDGLRQRYDNRGEDIRFLAWTLRDPHGNRLWPTVEAAKAQLDGLGKARLNLLVNAANEVNSVKPASAEGNSDETLSDSSPSI